MSNGIPPLPPSNQPLGQSSDPVNFQIAGMANQVRILMSQELMQPGPTPSIPAQIQQLLAQMQNLAKGTSMQDAVNQFVSEAPKVEKINLDMKDGAMPSQSDLDTLQSFNQLSTTILNFGPEPTDTLNLIQSMKALSNALSNPAFQPLLPFMKQGVTASVAKLQNDMQSEDPQTQKDMSDLLAYANQLAGGTSISSQQLQTLQDKVNAVLSDLGVNP